MTAARVSIVRCSSYDRAEVKEAVARAVELVGGAACFLPETGGVLLKPNLLAPLARERRITTDPEVVRAVAELFREAGAESISVGDSPAVGGARMVMRRAGYNDVLPEWVERVNFSEGRAHPTASHKDLQLAAAALDAGALVNLPKLKTHSYMGLTLAVKNLFGAVLGARKAQWHLRAGENRKLFARLLVEICYALRPALSVVDGIIGMDGRGPSNGRPRELGVIVAGDDPAAVDAVICRIVGFRPEHVPVMEEAARLGAGQTDLDNAEILGERIDDVAVRDFERATVPEGSLGISLPPFLAPLFKGALTSRPEIRAEACKLCANCAEICPPGAIEMDAAAGRKPEIDRAKCIRCFCCGEVCPHDAVDLRPGWLLRLASFFRRGGLTPG